MVSVVIACYNVEKYVEEAVRSVMNQTLRDIEIICVDDCSVDGTLAILEHLASEDSRIRIIQHKSNQGTLSVRCHGIQETTGEYVTFLDGDDWLSAETCKEALKVAGEQNVDIVQFAPVLFETQNAPLEQVLNLERVMAPCKESLSREEGALVNECFLQRKLSWNLCGKLFKTSVMKKASQFFDNEHVLMAEDMLHCFMALVFSKGYAGLDKPYYHYRQGAGVTAISQYMPVERMQAFAQEYQVYSLLSQWLERLQVKEKYLQAYEFVRKTVYQDMYYAFAHRIYGSDYPRAAEILSQYWPAEELAVAMSWGLYREESWIKKAELIGALKHADFLQVKPRNIKTVGTFYFRMYNGGVERVISKLASVWQKNGWRIVVFTEEINELDYALPEGVIRVIIPRITEYSLDNIEARTRAWIKAIQEYQIDVMVYHAWLVKELMGDQIAIKSTGIPMVMHTHGLFSIGLGEPGMSYQYQAATQKNGYALCDVVVTLGEVDTAWWNSLGYRAVKTINPSTYDVHTVQPASLKGKNVLWVGRISEQKQVYEAFRVIQLVHEKVPDVRLQIVGSAETEEAMRQVREYLSLQGMESYVSLEGFQRDVRPYYEQAALVLWTAGFEGAPMGMVEAKAYGLPIVCYELANVDMVRKPKGMRVVRQKDCAEAAKQVVALLEDDALRTELGRESRESAEEISSFDLEAHWQHILDLAMQPKGEERMASQLTPMETTTQMAMDFLVKGMDYRVRFGNTGNESKQMDEDRMTKVKALEELYLDGYFVKAYMYLNKVFPKGGKARETLKRVASFFFK